MSSTILAWDHACTAHVEVDDLLFAVAKDVAVERDAGVENEHPALQQDPLSQGAVEIVHLSGGCKRSENEERISSSFFSQASL